MNDEPPTPMRLAGRTLKQPRHVCAFFHSREEQNRVLMPFFKEGFDRGEKIFHMVDARLRDEHLRACGSAGIDVEVALASRQLEVRTWDDAYLKDGCFEGDRMLRLVEDTLKESRQKHVLTRLMGNMEWSLEAAPGVADIIEYEAKVNHVSARYPDAIVCVYDLNRYSGTVVMDILRTHPLVIIGGVLQENPLYLSPDLFIEELRQRGTRRRSERSESAVTRAS